MTNGVEHVLALVSAASLASSTQLAFGLGITSQVQLQVVASLRYSGRRIAAQPGAS